MRRLTAVFCILTLMLLAGCNQKDAGSGISGDFAEESNDFILLEETTPFGYDDYDWETQLLADAFDAGTPIGDAGLACVTVEVTSVTDTELTVTVTAPDISDDLLDWYAGADGQGDYEAALEQKVVSLMEGKTISGTYTMSYTDVNGVPSIHYTQDYANAVSCGLLEFYSTLQNSMLDQMGGGSDG